MSFLLSGFQEWDGVQAKEVTYCLTPIAPERIKLVGGRKIFGVGSQSPGRIGIKLGDRICFYMTGAGIGAYATVTSRPEFWPNAISPLFSMVFRLKDVEFFPDNPRVLDIKTREKLESMSRSHSSKAWGFFVRTMHRISNTISSCLLGPTNLASWMVPFERRRTEEKKLA